MVLVSLLIALVFIWLKIYDRDFPGLQWLGIHLPMQGTQIWSLVWEDPTCRRAAKPVHHNNWACYLEPTSHNYWASMLQLLKPALLEPVLHNKRSHCNEKPTHRNEELAPLAATRESPCAATKIQHSQNIYMTKIIYIFDIA